MRNRQRKVSPGERDSHSQTSGALPPRLPSPGGWSGGVRVSPRFANDAAPHAHAERPLLAKVIHRLAVPIILGWLGVVVVLSLTVPPLEVIGDQHSVSLSPTDAPSIKSMRHIANVFNEGSSDSAAMILLEGKQPLGDDAHRFYNDLIRKLRADTADVHSLQDWWGIRSRRPACKALTARPRWCR